MENQNENQIFAQAEEQNIEPPKTGLATVFFRTLAGGFGGAIGSIVIFVIIMLTQATLQNVFTGEMNPVFIFIVLAIAFLGSVIGSIASAALISYTEQAKYTRMTSMLVQVFILNILTFVVLAPIYVVVITQNPSLLVFVGAVHVFISTMGSAFIMEILADFRYAILSVYSISASLLISAFVMFFILMSSHTIGNDTINDASTPILPLLTVLPICWASIGFFVGIAEMIYRWMYETYGTDYLNVNTKYGVEYDKANANEEDYDEPEESKDQIFNS